MGFLATLFSLAVVTIGGGGLGLMLAPLHLRVPKAGGLSGIGDITAPFHAKKIGDNLLRELHGVLREQPVNWTTVGDYGRLRVEARRVPDIAESDVLVARARGSLPRADAADVLEFLQTEEGLRLAFDTAWISASGGAPTVEAFPDWRDRDRSTLRVVETVSKLPGRLAPRELVALVGYDPAGHVVVVKSVLHRQRRELKNRVRGLVTFHARVTQDGDDAAIEVVRYLDASGLVPSVLVNFVNCKRALPRLFSALHGRFAGRRSVSEPRRSPEAEAARLAANARAKADRSAARASARRDGFQTITDENRDSLGARARVDGGGGDYAAVDAQQAARPEPRDGRRLPADAAYADVADLQRTNEAALAARARARDAAELEAAYGPVGVERRLRRWVTGRL